MPLWAEQWLRDWATRTRGGLGAFVAGEIAALERRAARQARSQWQDARKHHGAPTPNWRRSQKPHGAGARSTCVISTEVPQFVEVLSKPRSSNSTRFAMRPSTGQTNALVTMMLTILLSVSLHGLSSVPRVTSYSRWYAAHAS